MGSLQEYEVENDIDSDEFYLIRTLKPLFNIKNNPNSKLNAVDNPTKIYRSRRLYVMKQTRSVIKCKHESIEAIKKSLKPSEDAVSYNDQVVSYKNECIEYIVSIDQDIAIVTMGIEDLPLGESCISIYDSANPARHFDGWRFNTTGRNTHKNPRAQNVYNYFANNHNKIRRSILINEWMKKFGIKEITVKVCECSSKGVNKSKIMSKSKHLSDAYNIPAQSKMGIKDTIADFQEKGNEIYLITCSKEKAPGGNQNSSIGDLSFNDILGDCRIQLQDFYQQNGGVLNWDNCLPAHERYVGPILYSNDFRQALADNPERVLIVSALFGIIRPTDVIPEYDLKMTSVLNGTIVKDFWGNQHLECEECVLNRALMTIKNNNPDTVFVNMLSKDYQDAFCGFVNGIHEPQLNFVPDLILPPNNNNGEVNFQDRMGRWRRHYILNRI